MILFDGNCFRVELEALKIFHEVQPKILAINIEQLGITTARRESRHILAPLIRLIAPVQPSKVLSKCVYIMNGLKDHITSWKKFKVFLETYIIPMDGNGLRPRLLISSETDP